MRRELHVRFREGLGVKFPRATRLVVVFEYEDDARRVLAVLPKRFGRYGLALHPEKTRLVAFRRPEKGEGPPSGGDANGPGSFDLLGFTHHWARSRRGNWVVKLRTSKSRFSRALTRVRAWCREHRHHEVSWQWQVLVAKLRGHYGYFGVTGNTRALERFCYEVVCVWRKWLSRRSNRTRHGWSEVWTRLLKRYPLPEPRIMRAFTTDLAVT